MSDTTASHNKLLQELSDDATAHYESFYDDLVVDNPDFGISERAELHSIAMDATLLRTALKGDLPGDIERELQRIQNEIVKRLYLFDYYDSDAGERA